VLHHEVGPDPVDEHHQAVAKTDQEPEVDERPREERQRARETDAPELGDGAPAPDRRQNTLVEVLEGDAGLARDRAAEVGGDGSPHLDRDRAHARQRRRRARGNEQRHVADDEDLGMAGQ